MTFRQLSQGKQKEKDLHSEASFELLFEQSAPKIHHWKHWSEMFVYNIFTQETFLSYTCQLFKQKNILIHISSKFWIDYKDVKETFKHSDQT